MLIESPEKQTKIQWQQLNNQTNKNNLPLNVAIAFPICPLEACGPFSRDVPYDKTGRKNKGEIINWYDELYIDLSHSIPSILVISKFPRLP